jgi:hypothetical protein
MAEIKYLDFELLVEKREGGYRARVLRSPAGSGTVSFSVP